MKTIITLAVGIAIGQFVAYGMVSLTPPAEAAPMMCEQPPEVKHLAAILASMPLDISVKEIGTVPMRLPRAKPAFNQALKEAGLL